MKKKQAISQASYKMLFDYLNRFEQIRDPRFETLLKEKLIGLWTASNEEILHYQGEICTKAWFIITGMVYFYFLDQEKEEPIVFRIFRAGEVVMVADSFRNGNPSTFSVVVCADSELLEITKRDTDYIQEQFPKVYKQEIGILASITEKARERERLYLLEPKARIKEFFEKYPDLHPAVKAVKMMDKHIASFLNLTAEHFCRIKNMIYSKNRD